MLRSVNRIVVVITVANDQDKRFPLIMSNFPVVQQKKDNQEEPQPRLSFNKVKVASANPYFDMVSRSAAQKLEINRNCSLLEWSDREF